MGDLVMSARNAQQLVDSVRAQVGVYDNTLLRDGFDNDDLGEADHAILKHLNIYLRALIPTGYVKCTFTQVLTPSLSTYTIDSEIGNIESVVYFDTFKSGVPLKQTDATSLDRKFQMWRSVPAGVPRDWYANPPRTFGLYPAPSVSGAYVQVVAETTADDLVDQTDVPVDLFNGYHDEVGFGTALQICMAMSADLIKQMGAEAFAIKMKYLTGRDERLQSWVQQLAQQRGQNETKQITPFERRQHYGSYYGRY